MFVCTRARKRSTFLFLSASPGIIFNSSIPRETLPRWIWVFSRVLDPISINKPLFVYSTNVLTRIRVRFKRRHRTGGCPVPRHRQRSDSSTHHVQHWTSSSLTCSQVWWTDDRFLIWPIEYQVREVHFRVSFHLLLILRRRRISEPSIAWISTIAPSQILLVSASLSNRTQRPTGSLHATIVNGSAVHFFCLRHSATFRRGTGSRSDRVSVVLWLSYHNFFFATDGRWKSLFCSKNIRIVAACWSHWFKNIRVGRWYRLDTEKLFWKNPVALISFQKALHVSELYTMKHVIDIQDYGGKRVARLLPTFRTRFDEHHLHVLSSCRRVSHSRSSFILDPTGTTLLSSTLSENVHCQSWSWSTFRADSIQFIRR